MAIWGLLYSYGGISILTGGVELQSLSAELGSVTSAIVKQHAWNLTWFGIAAIIGANFIWRKNTTAIWVTAMICGLADLGRVVFI